jgi:serine/threonine-protein kinase
MLGRKVNNYEVRSLLGEGGMGAVYVAEHPLIGRKVAVKVLKRAFAEDATLVQRFLNEARAANAIHHANIIEILDAGTLDDGLPYLIMELLEGESLGSRLRRAGRLGAGDAIEIACQAASALTAAHAKNIVHRDLKPDNLFLVRDRDVAVPERVKVLDFGIAKLQKELSGPVHTNTGSILGTPPYMSPEQCRGVSEEIDHRSDVYSLGIILYEMICGRPPFTSQGFGDVLMMQMAMVPPPPSSLNPEIPPPLERTILRALEKRREDRFATMADFHAELSAQRTQSGLSRGSLSEADALKPTLAPSPPVGEKVVTTPVPARSRRPVLLGGAALAGAAVVIVALSLGSRGREVPTAPSPERVAAPSPAATPPPPAAEAPRPAPAPVVDGTAAPARVVEAKAPVRRRPPRAKAPEPAPRLEKL